jgi:hypothetical protein
VGEGVGDAVGAVVLVVGLVVGFFVVVVGRDVLVRVVVFTWPGRYVVPPPLPTVEAGCDVAAAVGPEGSTASGVTSDGSAVLESVARSRLAGVPLAWLLAEGRPPWIGFTPVAAMPAGTQSSTATAVPPMMGRRSRSGRWARCLPT